MRRLPAILLALAIWPCLADAQTFTLPAAARRDSAALAVAMPALAQAVLAQWRDEDRDVELNTRFRLEMVAGRDRDALVTLAALRNLRAEQDPEFAPVEYAQYELFARVRSAATGPDALPDRVRAAYATLVGPMSDLQAFRVAGSLQLNPSVARAALDRALGGVRDGVPLALPEAVALCRAYHTWLVYGSLLPAVRLGMRDDDATRYVVDSTVRIPMRDGTELSAIVVRPRRLDGRQPAVLEFTIYAGPANHDVALEAAAHGFVGVVATTRGKRASGGPIVPFVPDANDGYDVVDWISRQPWSSGAVGMLGGSYSGFTQWATAKRLHPALKTIVPAAAIMPGFDSPRENGIFLNFQYPWTRYVGNGPLLDDATYGDRAHWRALDSTWFARGSAYRDLDRIDGAPNPMFREWLAHPTYDAWWQAMVPQGREYAGITIPVLSITGYFDGAQAGALRYRREHLANFPAADHTLLIGPWEHFGAQRRPQPVLGAHVLDPVARVDVIGLIYEWMAHVLRGGPRPALLADRVNFEVMGENRWAHVSSLAAMATDTLRLALARATGRGQAPRLAMTTAGTGLVATISADFRDRTHESEASINVNADTTLETTNGMAFMGPTLTAPTTISGAFTGALRVAVNARDVDLAVTLYERTAAGRYLQLSYALGRASLMRDHTTRQLLTPDVAAVLPLPPSRIISRVLPAGSRLVVVVAIQKSSSAQLNHGTGKDPSDETLADATGPLRVSLLGGSVIQVPVRR